MLIKVVISLHLISIALGSLVSHEQNTTVDPKLTEPPIGVEVEWIDPPIPLVRNTRSLVRGSTATRINQNARPSSIGSPNRQIKPDSKKVNHVKPTVNREHNTIKRGSVGTKNKLNENSKLLTRFKGGGHTVGHKNPQQQVAVAATAKPVSTGSNVVKKSLTNSADGKLKLPAPVIDDHKGLVEVSVNKNDKSDATANVKVNQNIYASPDGKINLDLNGGASKNLNKKDYSVNGGLNLDHSKGGSLGLGIDYNDKAGTTGSVSLKQNIYASADGATTFDVNAIASKSFDHGDEDKQVYFNVNSKL